MSSPPPPPTPPPSDSSPKRGNLKRSPGNNGLGRRLLHTNDGDSVDPPKLKPSKSTLEVRLRGKEEPIRRIRSVEFNARVKVQQVTPLTSMVKPNELWLQGSELAKLKEKRKRDVKKYLQLLPTSTTKGSSSKSNSSALTSSSSSSSNHPNTPMDSIVTADPKLAMKLRGLENYVDAKTIKNRKLDSLDAVLLEQAEQFEIGAYDEEQIAKSYQRSTTVATEMARLRAQQDASEIETYLMSPRTKRLIKKSPPPPTFRKTPLKQ